jgi:2-dehydro-3-deoxyphosphogluconate aldolase/(4S)-4-hydroxy-2-oxoglutarate aldolase
MDARERAIDRIHSQGLIPVIRLATSRDAIRAADAILKGGASILEVTMNVPGALGVIRDLRGDLEDEIVVGAGTVLDPQTARAAILEGARFVVSPVMLPEVITMCRRYGVVVIPGAMTPTEVLGAFEAGADMVKVFPAGALGGPSYIRALKAPMPQVPLVPTGGVNLKNAGDYIMAGASALGVGESLVDPAAVKDGRWEIIKERTAAFIRVIEEARQGVQKAGGGQR